MKLRRLSIFILFVASIVTVTIHSVSAQDRTFRNAARQQAEALLKQMTLDEKVGQLTQSPGKVTPGVTTKSQTISLPEAVLDRSLAGGVKKIDRLQRIAVEKSRLHIPIIVGFDVIHGYRTAETREQISAQLVPNALHKQL